jgi:multicomponent K+:H+ antiporter subunit A
MLFDLGVFILVVGATTLILTAIAHQSLRRPKRPAPAREAPLAQTSEDG